MVSNKQPFKTEEWILNCCHYHVFLSNYSPVCHSALTKTITASRPTLYHHDCDSYRMTLNQLNFFLPGLFSSCFLLHFASSCLTHAFKLAVQNHSLNLEKNIYVGRIAAWWSRGRVLAFSTQVRGFKPGRSRRIFRAKKSSAHPPSDRK